MTTPEKTITYDTLDLLLGLSYIAMNFVSMLNASVSVLSNDFPRATFWIMAALYSKYSLEQLKGKSK